MEQDFLQKLSPMTRQALMKYIPNSLSARTRNEFSEIVYNELNNNILLKRNILSFFIKKNNIKEDPLAVENRSEILVLTPYEVEKLVSNKTLKTIREQELEIFGIGEDFIETNDDYIDTINLKKIETLLELAVSSCLMTNVLPTKDEIDITLAERENFYLPLRTMLKGKPCTLFVEDVNNYLLNKISEIANNHLSLVMPFQYEEIEYDEDADMTISQMVFEREGHSEKSYYELCQFILERAEFIIDEHLNEIPDNNFYINTKYKKSIDIFTQNIIFKDIHSLINIKIENFYKDIKENFNENNIEKMDIFLEKIAEKLIDEIDLKLEEIEQSYLNEETIKNKGVSLINKKSIQKTLIYDQIIDEEESYFFENKEVDLLYD